MHFGPALYARDRIMRLSGSSALPIQVEGAAAPSFILFVALMNRIHGIF